MKFFPIGLSLLKPIKQGNLSSKFVLKRTFSKKTEAFNYTPYLNKYLDNKKRRFQELSNDLIHGNFQGPELAAMGKEFSSLEHLNYMITEREKLMENIQSLLSVEKEEAAKGDEGAEFVELAKEERLELQETLKNLDLQIIKVVAPAPEEDGKGALLEVRAGTGGEEASIFASEIFKMYQGFALQNGWRFEETNFSKSDAGGFKEAQAMISGESVFKLMKFESGVHRVQRIPFNDTKIQTSAASVIVMPDVEDMEFTLRPQDIRVDVYRSSGAGGQSVNRTESAVRMTHIPTGITVAMQDERSQIQNRARAMKILRTRVYDHERQKQLEARYELRSAANGTGDRSDKIRTYNFPQDRVTDHRASITVNGMERILSGEFLGEIIYRLVDFEEQNRISNFFEDLLENNK